MLSIVIPAYYEAGNLKVLHEQIVKVLLDDLEEFEIIFVDDGSKDDTYKEIEQLSGQIRG